MPLSKYSAFVATHLFTIAISTTAFADDHPNNEIVTETIQINAVKNQLMLDLPNNITQINQQQIDRINALHPAELLRSGSGTWVAQGNGQESTLSIRSAVLTGASSCATHLISQDGIPVNGAGFCNTNQLLSAQTELAHGVAVNRGTNNILNSSNAFHGSVDVSLPEPGHSDKQSLLLEGGSDDFYRLTYNYFGSNQDSNHSNDQQNSALNNGLFVGAVATHDSGYHDSASVKQQKIAVKHRTHKRDWQITSALQTNHLNQETAGYLASNDANIYKNKAAQATNTTPDAYRDAESVQIYSRIQQVWDDESYFYVLPYARSNTNEFVMHWLPWAPVEKNHHDSAGFKAAMMNAKGANYRWSSGAEAEFTQGDLQQIDTQFDPSSSSNTSNNMNVFDYEVDALKGAAFSQVNWQAAKHTDIQLGSRFEHIQYDYNNLGTDGSVCTTATCRYYRPTDATLSYSGWNYEAAILQRLNQKHSAWLSAKRGFRFPETSELFRWRTPNNAIQNETIKSIELGFRGEFTWLQYELTAYAMRKENVLVRSTQDLTSNQGETKHHGVEAQLRIHFTNDVWVNGFITQARHRYNNSPALASLNAIKGNDVDTAPRSFGNIELNWQASSQLLAAIDVAYVGRYFLDANNEHDYDGHRVVNLRLNQQVTPNINAYMHARNITDSRYANRADYAFGQYRYFTAKPRSFYAGVEYTF